MDGRACQCSREGEARMPNYVQLERFPSTRFDTETITLNPNTRANARPGGHVEIRQESTRYFGQNCSDEADSTARIWTTVRACGRIEGSFEISSVGHCVRHPIFRRTPPRIPTAMNDHDRGCFSSIPGVDQVHQVNSPIFLPTVQR